MSENLSKKESDDRIAQAILSDEERDENTKAIHSMDRINRFRLMFGLPLFPEEK